MSEDKLEISNDLQITSYCHCGLCVTDIKLGRAMGHSPASYANYSVGWTPRGLQVWCNRHNCNILNIDFEGKQHPAVTSRKAPEVTPGGNPT